MDFFFFVVFPVLSTSTWLPSKSTIYHAYFAPPCQYKLQGRLLKAFCPILRFDATEKHFPISADRFISSSVLFRKQGRRKKKPQPPPPPAPSQHQHDSPELDRGDDNTNSSGNSSSDEESLVDAGVEKVGVPSREGAVADDTPLPLMQRQEAKDARPGEVESVGQACGECGETQGQVNPPQVGWIVVPLPPGVESWSTKTLLLEQRKSGKHCSFRYDFFWLGCTIWLFREQGYGRVVVAGGSKLKVSDC